MQNDNKRFWLPDNAENIHEQIAILKEANEKLLQENQELKKSIQSEQILHSILYKQWQELKNKETADSKPGKEFPAFEMMQGVTFKWVLIIVLPVLILVASYMLLKQKEKGLPAIVTNSSMPPREQLPHRIPSNNNLVKDINPADARPLSSVTANKHLQSSAHILGLPHITQPAKVLDSKSNSKSNGTPLYKVKSKAFFHNNPDSNTRRKAFIVHWNNTYTTLKPLKEKNGFVYVVFTNHLGQTSRGWLRKNDLYPVDKE